MACSSTRRDGRSWNSPKIGNRSGFFGLNDWKRLVDFLVY